MLFTCSECAAHKEVKGTRLPRDWHRRKDAVFCPTCWHEKFYLRAITFPVVGPTDEDWPRLRLALRPSWNQSTAFANWLSTELRIKDVHRRPKHKKCPKRRVFNLYDHAKNNYPDWGDWRGAYGAASAVVRNVELKYKARRFKVIWTNEESLSSFKYPYPFPVRAQDWSIATVNERPVFYCNLLNETKVELILAGGAPMRRQLAAFKLIESGEAIGCEAAIYRKSSMASDHRNGVSAAGHNTPRRHHRVMVKLVAWLPRQEKVRKGDKVYAIKSAEDCFLMSMDGWRLNSDFIKTAVANHRVFLDRMAEDTKHEKRWPKRKLKNINEFRAVRCRKQIKRLKTFCQQTAAMIAGRAQRLGYDSVELDLGEQKYIPHGFPWSAFATMVGHALDKAGITLLGDKPAAGEADAEVEAAE